MTPTPAENSKTNRPHGDWPSRIDAQAIVSDSISIEQARQSGKTLFYIEGRPQESGRCVIVKLSNGNRVDILPPLYSARSRVHEYGGGSYCVSDDLLFFINDSDQDIYLVRDDEITRITDIENLRFADFSYDKKSQRLITICESHQNKHVENYIASIDINNGEIKKLESGNDFYASPRLNNSATQLCWQTWNHPNMPWQGNQLWLADIKSDGLLHNKIKIAGGTNVSTFQPSWSAEDVLHFISDDDGWWHLYNYAQKKSTENIKQLTFGEKEFALPQWVFAQSTYAFINNHDIICCYQEAGKSILAKLSFLDKTNTPELRTLNSDWQEFSSITADKNNVAFIAASGHCFAQLVSAQLASAQAETAADKPATFLSTSVVKTSCLLPVSSEYYSQAEIIEFINRKGQNVFANYYPPKNPDCQPNTESKPPLIIICHGGPTGQSSIALDAKKQFWTSRGFALLDVNYSGSTGYGREYRERLNKKWGILDVEDCCDAALYAVEQGLANKDQLIIRGSSAGGYTVLAALTFAQVFSAGASYYGISELSSLAKDTHKFESHYLDGLIGLYPEESKLYQQRSPINHSDQLNCPVIFFQGIEDRVVPKQQAENMFEALDKKGLPVAAQYFSGEQHGFRKAETIEQCLENELSFYQLIFNLKPKDEIHFKGNIQIKNT